MLSTLILTVHPYPLMLSSVKGVKIQTEHIKKILIYNFKLFVNYHLSSTSIVTSILNAWTITSIIMLIAAASIVVRLIITL